MVKHKKISENIEKIIIDNPKTPNEALVWINICNAGKKEIEYLRKKYRFELPHLQASLAKSFSQRPIINYGSDYLFIILHFPVLQGQNIIAGEIEFFIGDGYLVTLHNKNIDVLSDFFSLCKKDGNSMLSYEFESSSILLYELLEKLMMTCYAILDKNSIAIATAEDRIFEQEQKHAVSIILSLRRNIINFRKIMRNHKNIIQKLQQEESHLFQKEKIKNYYDELIEHTKRIWDIVESQRDMIEVLNSTNESLLNYRISDIMKTLTIFSVIVFPLTLLAAIFGMNTTNSMPFMNHPFGFWIIIGIMTTGSLGMLLFFEKKKWL